jgi:asparagine synthase (glutamine-hydrolysing)
MCGIVGKLNFDPEDRIERAGMESMLAPIAHRGPDGRGVYLDRNVGLGHCRLSIIDVAGGSQPMANEDETVWIVFNGEIYNFPSLRRDLLARGHVFRSRTDTEVILHLYEEYGVDCVKHLRGMFAFAIWDAQRRRLFLARDRVGIKPLYYSRTQGALYFASELKAIIADPAVSREICTPAIRQFLSFFYVPGENTLFQSVKKLLPGHYLVAENGNISISRYWDLQFTRERWAVPFDDVAEELRELLGSTVSDHMIADVPVGVLLSGGVDSSAVLSFAVQRTGKKVKTFTVGFDGGNVVDERPYARLTAEQFGTEHHDISITAQDFWNFLPMCVRHMEEPVCEPPAVALYFISKLAHDHVKVLLSGEGGDEAFAGYPNYANLLRLNRLRTILGPLSKPLGAAVRVAGTMFGEARIQRYGQALGCSLPAYYFSRTSGPMSFFNRQAPAFFTWKFWEDTSSASPEGFIAQLSMPVRGESLLNQMLYVDSKTWLPDDLLVKADKMTMANSLELRVPLLDHEILEFAASLPADFKVRGRETKRVLKAAFAKVLPTEVLSRRKAGFPVPYESWLRHEFKREIEGILLSDCALSRGYFEKNEIGRLLRANEREGGRSKEVFSLLVLELWHRQFVDAPHLLSNDKTESSLNTFSCSVGRKAGAVDLNPARCS